MQNQNQITNEGPLLDESGRLIEAGYATSLIKTYNRNSVCSKLKRKEWDYYFISDTKIGLALTVADNGYMGLLSASLLDFSVPQEHTSSIMTLFPMGAFNLPTSSKNGVTEFHNKQCDFVFTVENGLRNLHCRFDNFQSGKTLTANITLSDEPSDSMVIATPFDFAPKAFYYNQKINSMRASGYIQFDDKKTIFYPDTARGLLDWGRGVWTYDNTWLWSSASGIVQGKEFAFNLGYGFGNTSNATENMIIYEGKSHKLGNVTFDIPLKDFSQKNNGKKLNLIHNFMQPWKFSSNDGRFTADFVPIIDRSSCTDFKFLLSDQHQVFGRFTGDAILDDGTIIHFSDFFGFAEKVHNKW